MPSASCILPVLVVLAALGCNGQRGVAPLDESRSEISVGPIDWNQSAGVFIGIEAFHAADAPLEVPYAVDDAVDLAYLFTNELGLLAPEHTAALLSGRPHKERSRQHLDTLTQRATVMLDDVDAARVYDAVDKQLAQLGARGVLVLAIATHGYTTTGGQHVLLTADSGASMPRGVVLGEILRRQKRGRLLLFVGACRERLGSASAPDSATAMSEKFFEELRGAGGYAVFSASAPGGFAYSDDTTQNGFFTRALIATFHRQAAAHDEGCALTLGSLDSEVSQSVLARSGGRQKPEARFGGGLADLCVLEGGAEVGEISYPPQGAEVCSSDDVKFSTVKPGLFAAVLLCAHRNGVCYRQNLAPIPTPPRRKPPTSIHVQYGTPDSFDVYVALSTDRKFLNDQRETDGIPFERDTHHVVHLLGPITVTFRSPGKEPCS
jgi:hypothetical protein